MGLFKKIQDEYGDIYNDVDDAIEELDGTIVEGDCMYCNAVDGMKYEGDICFICSSCGNAVHKNIYYMWTAGFPVETNGDVYVDESYEDVYDEDGFSVQCDMCNSIIKWKDGLYICPDCGQTFSRPEFFNYIGAEPPGEECTSCDNIYPGCTVCPHGYVDD